LTKKCLADCLAAPHIHLFATEQIGAGKPEILSMQIKSTAGPLAESQSRIA
jgi:hypothetical protein